MIVNSRRRCPSRPQSPDIVGLENEREDTLNLFLGPEISRRYGESLQTIKSLPQQFDKKSKSSEFVRNPRKKVKLTEPRAENDTTKARQEQSASSERSQNERPSLDSLLRRHDNLRTKLIKAGVWYENVDDLIAFCEGDPVLKRKSTDSDLSLSAPEAEELTLEKATALLPGLRIDLGPSTKLQSLASRRTAQAEGTPKPQPERSSLKTDQDRHRIVCDERPTSGVPHDGFPEVQPSAIRNDVSGHSMPETLNRSTTAFVDNRQSSKSRGDTAKVEGSFIQQASQNSKGRKQARKSGKALGYPKRIKRTASACAHIVEDSSRDRSRRRASAASSQSALLKSLQSGEYGCNNFWTRSPRQQLRLPVFDDLKAWKRWKGGSHDVLNVSWNPDGTTYAAGTAALTDSHTMQYNGPNNLLLGNLVTNSMTFLPDHRTPRPHPEDVRSGPNSLMSTYSTTDTWLYQSVSALSWSPTGDHLFSASYDETCKVWDVGDPSSVKCISTLHHEGRIEVMALSKTPKALLATGAWCSDESIRVYASNEAGVEDRYSVLQLPKALGHENKPFPHAPTCLQFGSSNSTSNFLIAGFASSEREGNGWPAIAGALGLWQIRESNLERRKVTPFSQNVFDAVWSPYSSYFATGNAAPALERKKNTVNSQIRIYDILQSRRILEFDCAALDINTVTFCEFDANYVTASCTDNSTYVFDSRRPDQLLHRLQHAEPMGEPSQGTLRELTDVGVRVALWGVGINHFLTGGSDGNLKRWDIRRSSEDVFIKDVIALDAEIMSGHFSADKSNLLLGDGSGGISLLSVAPLNDDIHIENTPLDREAPQNTQQRLACHQAPIQTLGEGQKAARDMVSTGQLIINPKLGAIRGPHYKGPFARWARPMGTLESDLGRTPLLPSVRKLQFDNELRIAKKLDRKPREVSKEAVIVELDDSQEQQLHKSKETLSEKRRHMECLSEQIEVVDLTLDDTLSGTADRMRQEPPKSLQRGRKWVAWWNDGDKWDEEDHYFPPNSSVGANLILDNA